MRFALIISILFLASCTSLKNKYQYHQEDTFAFINLLESKAVYTAHGAFSGEREAFDVQWEVPSSLEKGFKDGSALKFIDAVPSEELAGKTFRDLKKAFKSADSSAIKEELIQICGATDADAIVVLTSDYTDLGTGGLNYINKGFGIYSSFGITYRAFSTAGIGLVNCNPLDYSGQLLTYSKSVKLKDLEIAAIPSELTEDELATVREDVLKTLYEKDSEQNTEGLIMYDIGETFRHELEANGLLGVVTYEFLFYDAKSWVSVIR